jgi:hypothetical protein
MASMNFTLSSNLSRPEEGETTGGAQAHENAAMEMVGRRRSEAIVSRRIACIRTAAGEESRSPARKACHAAATRFARQ